ncbi:MAG TPA: hypothetical protein VM934_09385 [Pyrinomonadaceae bacterium]|nr:hypothetical protein [Pyrinomonadaceae bacterium]
MSEEENVVRPEPERPTSTAKSSSLARRLATYALVLLVGLLIGFVPTWLRARDTSARLVASERQLTLAGMQNNLSSAAIDARRGDYEPARQAASQFFTTLRAEADKGEASALTQAQKLGVPPLFTPRDEIITLLARSDPAAAERLTDLYVAYRKLMGA